MRTTQPWERSRQVTVFDLASSIPMEERRCVDVRDVPIGYAVTSFLRKASRIPQNKSAGSSSIESRSVELDFTVLAYNMYNCCLRYSTEQPLCGFFLKVLDGRYPAEVDAVCRAAFEKVRSELGKADVLRHGSLTFKQVATSLFTLYEDQPHRMWRSILRSLIATAATSNLLLTDRLAIDAIGGIEGTTNGASMLMRQVRRGIVEAFEEFYENLENALEEIVEESYVQPGLILLAVPAAIDLLKTKLDAPTLRADSKDNPDGAASVNGAPSARDTICSASYSDFALSLFDTLPRLNASVHLKHSRKHESPSPVTPPPEHSGARSRRKKANVSVRGAQAAELLVEAPADQTLVEWYGFCQRARRTMPTLHNKLFDSFAPSSASVPE